MCAGLLSSTRALRAPGGGKTLSRAAKVRFRVSGSVGERLPKEGRLGEADAHFMGGRGTQCRPPETHRGLPRPAEYIGRVPESCPKVAEASTCLSVCRSPQSLHGATGPRRYNMSSLTTALWLYEEGTKERGTKREKPGGSPLALTTCDISISQAGLFC